MSDTEVTFSLTSRDQVAFESASLVCRVATIWFYLKSWIQDLEDSLDDRDADSAKVLAKHIEYTSSSLRSARSAGMLSRIDIDDSAMIFGPKEYRFSNAPCVDDILAAGSTASAIQLFMEELSLQALGDKDWLKNALKKGHIKVLAEMGPELGVAEAVGVTDLIPRNWLL
jgi:hypothetical protein